MQNLDAREIAARLGRGALIDALERAFRGNVEAPPRQHYALGDGHGRDVLLIMPAWRTGGRIGVKLTTVFPGNAAHGRPAVHAAYALFDGTTGVPLALLDGTELTRRRTAAASALAARHLARADARRLLIVGTGALAPHLIESHAVVRPIDTVRVWGRRAAAGAQVAAGFPGRNFAVAATGDLEAAVRWADIVSCATLADAPLVHGAWLREGQHLDLVGSFTRDMREADDEALRRARLYVDTRAGALAESGEIIHAIEAGVITAADIRGELAELVRGSAAGRGAAGEITLFKSVGCAIEDLAAAELALQG